MLLWVPWRQDLFPLFLLPLKHLLFPPFFSNQPSWIHPVPRLCTNVSCRLFPSQHATQTGVGVERKRENMSKWAVCFIQLNVQGCSSPKLLWAVVTQINLVFCKAAFPRTPGAHWLAKVMKVQAIPIFHLLQNNKRNSALHTVGILNFLQLWSPKSYFKSCFHWFYQYDIWNKESF